MHHFQLSLPAAGSDRIRGCEGPRDQWPNELALVAAGVKLHPSDGRLDIVMPRTMHRHPRNSRYSTSICMTAAGGTLEVARLGCVSPRLRRVHACGGVRKHLPR